jgi:hypothetical protein
MRRLVAMIVGPLVGLMACNALTGVGDLGTSAGPGANAGDDGGRDGDVRTDGDGAIPFVDGSTGDAGVDPTIIVITPSLAVCGTDSLCITNSDGWSPALNLLFGAASGCPTTWPTAKTYKSAGGGSCGCKCTANGAACTGAIEARTGAACAGPPTTLAVASDGGCTDTMMTLPTPISLTQTGTPPASCNGAVVSNLGGAQQVHTCSGVALTPSSSCATNEVCVPKAPKTQFGFPAGSVCMAHDGQAGCPKNLPIRVIAGSDVIDGRSCGASCTCAPSPDCKGGKLETSTSPTCAGVVRTLDVDGTCNTGATGPATTFRYIAPNGCVVKDPPQTLGSQTVQSPRTFCCAQPF